jgi:hypothetical protein
MLRLIELEKNYMGTPYLPASKMLILILDMFDGLQTWPISFKKYEGDGLHRRSLNLVCHWDTTSTILEQNFCRRTFYSRELLTMTSHCSQEVIESDANKNEEQEK